MFSQFKILPTDSCVFSLYCWGQRIPHVFSLFAEPPYSFLKLYSSIYNFNTKHKMLPYHIGVEIPPTTVPIGLLGGEIQLDEEHRVIMHIHIIKHLTSFNLLLPPCTFGWKPWWVIPLSEFCEWKASRELGWQFSAFTAHGKGRG